MRQLSAAVVVASLFGVAAIAAAMSENSTNNGNTAEQSHPALIFGPGPVINPENSQYMEDKNAAMKKEQQDPITQQPPNPHFRHHHGLLPPAQNQ